MSSSKFEIGNSKFETAEGKIGGWRTSSIGDRNGKLENRSPKSEIPSTRLQNPKAKSQNRACRVRGILLPVVAGWLAIAAPARAWGPAAHKLVNDWAVQTLPSEMRPFFEANRQFLIDHATDPDEWMKKDRYERMRHYIFLDKYGRFPYLNLPHGYKAANEQFGSGRVSHNGTLPWQIGEFSFRLTVALREGDWEQAKLDAAALGYYVAEANDPLHTTENFDGQLTEEKGLAERYGTALVGRYGHFFMSRPDDAVKIEDPTEYAFRIVLESNTWVDQVILADRHAREGLVGYNDDYFDRFYNQIGSQVSRLISKAGHDTGSYWYTAWLNAGRPQLPAR